jgi:predicted RNA binding protein YcfA (HicA-like mRNA interferase family)
LSWSTDDVIALVKHLGFTYARTNPHLIYEKSGRPRHVSIPPGRKVLVAPTLASIFRQIGITKREAEEIRKKGLDKR